MSFPISFYVRICHCMKHSISAEPQARQIIATAILALRLRNGTFNDREINEQYKNTVITLFVRLTIQAELYKRSTQQETHITYEYR